MHQIPDNTTPAVSAHRLRKRFRRLVAVNSIDFKIARGECFGFLGPNGAGKTTTVKMICCTSPRTGGSLRVLGLDTETSAREIKAQIGVVQQENNLDPDFTALHNLMIYSRYFSIPKEEALDRSNRLLKFVHLSAKRDTEIEELSGGMKRRLMIARALLNEPRILVLDEPTTGLDPQARHLIWNKIRSLREQGITVILTTHYMEEAQQLCDRIAIMDKGRFIAEGSPRELIRQHGGGGEVLEVSGDRSLLEDVLAYVNTTWVPRGAKAERIGLSVHIYTSQSRPIEDDMRQRFPHAERLARMANLEDVFLKLTGRRLRD